MPGTNVTFAANGREAAGHLALPDVAIGTAPGVVVVQEWWGLVDHIRRVADRFAAAGFVALAPDLYGGKVAASPDDAQKMMMALDIAAAGKALRGAARYLLAHDRVAPKKVAALGFCMGGQLALYAAAEYPEEIAAAVDFYGVHEKVRIAPEKFAGRAVQFHLGRRDRGLHAQQAVAKALRGAGAHVDEHLYDAGHAFFNDTRPTAYDEGSAELAWKRTVEFLRQKLI
ncbi:MAG TPA: dienelactone hydrolase family protein [Gemmatimonadaceae bacterium]|nr:dienelactone hydrolase family protein [Gemmatimonadaceae bacterium]